MDSTTPSAVAAPRRQLGPDLARGVMLLLIAMAYASVYAGAGFATPSVDARPIDRVAKVASTLLLDNRAFPMFAILFGYGLSWTVGRQQGRGRPDRDIRRQLRRRGLFLLLFGAVHAFLVFPGEILTSYGLSALAIGWLLFRSDRTIVRATWILTVIYVVTVSIGMIIITRSSETTEAAGVVPGYTTLADWVTRLAWIPVSPLFVAISFPLFLTVVLGFWAGRRRLLDQPEQHSEILKGIARVGITVSIVGAVPAGIMAAGVWSPDGTTGGLIHALQVLTGVLGGAGYAAVFGLVGARLGQPRGVASETVAAVGQRSLTCYLLNSVLVALLLHPDLGGLGHRIGAAGALTVGFLVWALTSAGALWLARTGRAGPLDALLRRLVYAGRPSEAAIPPATASRN